MTNSEWLKTMPQINMLKLLLRHTDGCPLYLLGIHKSAARCDEYSVDGDVEMRQTCIACMTAWLGEDTYDD